MSHPGIREQLADFAQGRLEVRRRAEIEEHLATCSACREWLETYDLLGRALAARRAREHPDGDELAAWVVHGAELPAESAAHLAACADCGREVELLGAAIGAARGERQREEAEARRLRTRRRSAVIGWAAAAGLVFALLAGSILLAPRGEMERDHVISGVTLTGEETIAARSIHASEVEIRSGSNIVFQAAEVVTFGEGFAVDSGATFQAGGPRRPDDRKQ